MVGNESGVDGALISLDEPKAFDRDNQQYLASALTTAGIGNIFRG